MNPNDAREHLEMVDRILAHADRTVHVRGTLFIVWGLTGALITLTIQAFQSFPSQARWWWAAPVTLAYVLAIAAQIYYVRRYKKMGGLNVVEAQFIRILSISMVTAMVASVGGWNILRGWGVAAVWSICVAIPLLFIGVQGQRYALAAGVVLLASLVVANFTPQSIGIALALGYLIGYVGVGVAFELERLSADG